jgi:hypothetical protein
LRSGRRVQRGSLAYVRLTPGFSTAQEESMVLVTLSAGQPASPRKYIITAHLSRFVPPLLAEPPVGAEDGR